METKSNISGTFTVCDEVSEFLLRLGRNGSWQYFCDFKKAPEKGLEAILWFEVGDKVVVPDWNAVYYPVHPQVGRLMGHQRGKIGGVQVINHLFSEFDTDKNDPRPVDEKLAELKKKVDALTPTPSIIVFSGGGWHCYWLLKSPVLVDGNIEYMKKIQYAWVDYTGGDDAAKDLARVLRVPTSFNNKPQYGEPRQVVFVKKDYSLEYTLDDLVELLDLEEVEEVPTGMPAKKSQGLLISADPNLYAKVVEALALLDQTRIDKYQKWVEIGMSIWSGFEGSSTGLAIWDMWSQKSPKYRKGDCAGKWGSFDSERDDKITLKRLFDLAQADSHGTFIKPAPKNAHPEDYMEVVHALGFRFTQNSMNDRIYVNGALMSDGVESLIMTKLRQYDYKQKGVFQDAFIAEGHENQFHPICDYLNSLVWDGKDHLGELGKYVTDKDGMFPILIRKWFVGAVSKNLAPTSKEQNPMLVFAGAQGKGKSVMVQWFGSSLPEFFIASPIYPDNKDFVINSSSHFVWEVEELGSTLRRQDIEALKAYLSRTTNSFRAPYGKFEIQKPVTASYIGTINPNGEGFLNDPTGNRRYRVCHITNIDWNYEKDLDINQLWAQAVALHNAGETYALDSQSESKMQTINERYSLDDALAPHILKVVEIVDDANEFVTTSEIMTALKNDEVINSEVDRSISMRVGTIMQKLGAEKETRRVNGVQVRGWAKVAKVSKMVIPTKKLTSKHESEL